MWWLSLVAFATDEVPVPDGKVASEPRRTFDSKEYEALEQFRSLYDERNQKQAAEIEALRTQLEQRALQQGLVTEQQLAAAAAGGGTPGAPPSSAPVPAPAGTAPSATLQGGHTPVPSATAAQGGRTVGSGGTGRGAASPAAAAPPANSLGQALVFSVPDVAAKATETVVPAGSYVKVRILTGVEATARDDLPMLVQADHALIGPNKRHIDLRGCFILLQVKGELSTDRVVGQAVTLSCVREDGEHVHREINGYLAGEDSTFGVTGQLISRQGRVMAAATVASLAQAAGEAVATAQEATTIVANPMGAAAEATNVEGNQAAYVAGSAAASGAGLIANWYLKYADQLLPAIAVGSGRDVWVVLLQSVEVPPLAVP
jgi:conjugal transfer pilus assembly protein TraB